MEFQCLPAQLSLHSGCLLADSMNLEIQLNSTVHVRTQAAAPKVAQHTSPSVSLLVLRLNSARRVAEFPSTRKEGGIYFDADAVTAAQCRLLH